MCSEIVQGCYTLQKTGIRNDQTQNFVHYQLWHAHLQAACLVNFLGLEMKVAGASATLRLASGRLPGLFVL
jgi:hypothetical protein